MTVSAFYDLVYFTTATTGTGTVTVGAAVSGARTPAGASVPDGTVVSYSIIDGANFEIGRGTYTVSGTTLTRDSVVASSNSGSKVSLSGAAVVSFTLLASDLAVVKIGDIATSGSQSTVDFTGIPQGFTNLKLVYAAQDSAAGTSYAILRMKINNDGTSGDYTTTYRAYSLAGSLDGSGVAASSAGMFAGLLNTSTNFMGAGELNLPSYAGTTFEKGIFGHWLDFTALNGVFTGTFGGYWSSTAAINRLTFTTDHNFVDGSRFTLYGIN